MIHVTHYEAIQNMQIPSSTFLKEYENLQKSHFNEMKTRKMVFDIKIHVP